MNILQEIKDNLGMFRKCSIDVFIILKGRKEEEISMCKV